MGQKAQIGLPVVYHASTETVKDEAGKETTQQRKGHNDATDFPALIAYVDDKTGLCNLIVFPPYGQQSTEGAVPQGTGPHSFSFIE